jgi:hypothetical protein
MEVDVELSDSTVRAVEEGLKTVDAHGKSQAEGALSKTSSPNRIYARALRYHLEIEMQPRSRTLRVRKESLRPLNPVPDAIYEKVGIVRPREIIKFIDTIQGKDGIAHLVSWVEPGLDTGYSLSKGEVPALATSLDVNQFPHAAAFKRELAGWVSIYFEPREKMRMNSPVGEVQRIGSMGEDLPAFLNTMKEGNPRQYQVLERAVKLFIPQIEGLNVGPNRLGEVELSVIENGVIIPARLISEGTLRMLGLLALSGTKNAATLVAIEEPENGVHPRRLELIANYLETKTEDTQTQYIVTTHSAKLPDFLPVESLYVCSRNGQETRILPFESEKDGPSWSRDVARAFMDPAEEVKISERILRGDFDA